MPCAPAVETMPLPTYKIIDLQNILNRYNKLDDRRLEGCRSGGHHPGDYWITESGLVTLSRNGKNEFSIVPSIPPAAKFPKGERF
jgi:hypothetical protein